MPTCNNMVKYGCRYCIENGLMGAEHCISNAAMGSDIMNPANLPTDRLGAMFKLQEILQKRLGVDNQSQKNKETMCMALMCEVVETLESTPWKPWKKTQHLDVENFKLEVVDIFHFAINLALSCGMSYEELYERFKAKNMENHSRQDRGY